MKSPLEGLKIVDFSRVLAGPLCTRTLQDLGAQVIKIEPPMCDVSRFAAPISPDGISGYYAQQNAGKTNISIDLNHQEAQEIALKLCEDADILVENFRPGALAAFGLDYETLSAKNPGLIYASVSGYGQHGPWSSRMAYAPTVQAECGFTKHSFKHFNFEGESRQTDSLSHADVYAGLQCTIAVLAALHQREVTGRGQKIDVAMAATIMAINEHAHVDLNALDLCGEPAILGATDGSFFIGPDGEEIMSAISLVGTLTFRFFLAAMRRSDLALDPRFATSDDRRKNLLELKEIVQNWIWTFPNLASLDTQFDEAKIAIGEVRSLQEVAESEWAECWGAIVEVPDRKGGVFKLPGHPWKFSDAELPKPGAPALQGEHNTAVCESLGLSKERIDEMANTGVLINNFASTLIATVQEQVKSDIQTAQKRKVAQEEEEKEEINDAE